MQYVKMKNYILYIFVIVTLVISTVLIFSIIIKNDIRILHINNYKNTYIMNEYIRIMDLYDKDNNPSLNSFFHEKDSLKKLKKTFKDFNESFDYFVIDKQNIESHTKYLGNEKFCSGYEEGSLFKNQKIETELGDTIYVTPLKSLQLNEKAFEEFNLNKNIDLGESFSNSSFEYYPGCKIPAILGAEYKEYYDIGGEFKGFYLNQEFDFKIIGFFSKNTSIFYSNKALFIDRYIVFPSLNYNAKPLNKEDETFQKILYSVKNWGWIKTNEKDNIESIEKEIERIADKNNVLYQLVKGESISKTNINNDFAVLTNFQKVIFLMFLFISAIMFLGSIIILIKLINLNMNVYAIHLICGASLIRIKVKIYLKIIIAYLVSFFLANTICFGILKRSLESYNIDFNNTLLKFTMIYFILIFVTLIILNFYMNSHSFGKALRKDS